MYKLLLKTELLCFLKGPVPDCKLISYRAFNIKSWHFLTMIHVCVAKKEKKKTVSLFIFGKSISKMVRPVKTTDIKYQIVLVAK